MVFASFLCLSYAILTPIINSTGVDAMGRCSPGAGTFPTRRGGLHHDRAG